MVIFGDKDMLLREILGIPVFVIVPGVAVTVGLGGGGLIVPTCMYLLDMSAKEATALSQALMFGAAVASIIVDFNSKEQNFNVPLIDTDLLCFMGPVLMAGALVGGIVNRASPNWFIIFSLILVLAISGFKTLRKGYFARKKNKRDSQIRLSMSNLNIDPKSPTESQAQDTYDFGADEKDEFEEPETEKEAGSSNNAAGSSFMIDSKITEEQRQVFDKRFENEDPQINWFNWYVIAGLWLFSLVMLVVRGSKRNPSFVGLEAGGVAFWVLTVLQIFVLFALGIYFGQRLISRTVDEDPDYTQYLYEKTCCTVKPTAWSPKKIYLLAPSIFFAGIVSGTVGIGGGMILGPIMLMAEVPARVVASVNASSILLSASSLAALYMIDGAIDPSVAIFYSFCCFVGALVGKKKTKAYFQKHDYALVYIMAAIIIISWLLVFLKVVDEVENISSNGWENFQDPNA